MCPHEFKGGHPLNTVPVTLTLTLTLCWVSGTMQVVPTLTVCRQSVRKSLIQAQVEGGSFVSQLIHQDVSDDGVESQAVVYEQHPDIASWLLEVAECCVKSCSDGILRRSVCSVGKLMWVQVWGETGLDVAQDEPLKAFYDN